MLKGHLHLLALTALVGLATGCESTMGTKDESAAGADVMVTESSAAASAADASASDARTTGVGAGTSFQGHPLDDPASDLSNRTLYFDFDSAQVNEDDRITVEAHSRYLAENGGASVTLEGHADERGTREYNIALGERRAMSIRQLMTLLGASGAQIRTVSYGEERPAVEGHDDSAWRFNRRVEIIYRNR